jgi:hypothetical protein
LEDRIIEGRNHFDYNSDMHDRNEIGAQCVAGDVFRIAPPPVVPWIFLCAVGLLAGAALALFGILGKAHYGWGGVGAVLAVASLCWFLKFVRLRPDSDCLVIGTNRFQYVQRRNQVIGQVPFANIAAAVLSKTDGGNSLWVQLIEPASSETFWPGGIGMMDVMYCDCGYHLVIGKHLQAPALLVLDTLLRRIEVSRRGD